MTVIRKSKCQYCKPYLLTWWDWLLDSKAFDWLYASQRAFSLYLTLGTPARKVGKRWHDRFHQS